jgi:hypothetical protein
MKVALVIVGLLIAAAIAWDAAERHYDNCVEAAHATSFDPAPSAEQILNDEPAETARRVEGCSRLPW